MSELNLLEYNTVRETGAGIWNYAGRGLIEVSGGEGVQFLNGLITNDAAKLEENKWMFAAFPNAQGRLIAMVRVLKKDGKFLFDTGAVTREKVFENLFRFTFAGDFIVHDLSDDFGVLSVQGEKSGEMIEKILGGKLTEENEIAEFNFNSENIFIIRARHLSENGFDLFVPKTVLEDLTKEFKNQGAIKIGDEAFETLRIEQGTPRYGVDMDETNVVLETGIDEAVNFNKGCYIGQEIIARIHFRGHVAKKLAGLVFEDENAEINHGDEIKTLDDKNAGKITSVTFSPKLGKKIALGYVRYAFLEKGTELKVGEAKASVEDLPFT
jgi:folate-binding protein YgfZ